MNRLPRTREYNLCRTWLRRFYNEFRDELYEATEQEAAEAFKRYLDRGASGALEILEKYV